MFEEALPVIATDPTFEKFIKMEEIDLAQSNNSFYHATIIGLIHGILTDKITDTLTEKSLIRTKLLSLLQKNILTHKNVGLLSNYATIDDVKDRLQKNTLGVLPLNCKSFFFQVNNEPNSLYYLNNSLALSHAFSLERQQQNNLGRKNRTLNLEQLKEIASFTGKELLFEENKDDLKTAFIRLLMYYSQTQHDILFDTEEDINNLDINELIKTVAWERLFTETETTLRELIITPETFSSINNGTLCEEAYQYELNIVKQNNTKRNVHSDENKIIADFKKTYCEASVSHVKNQFNPFENQKLNSRGLKLISSIYKENKAKILPVAIQKEILKKNLNIDLLILNNTDMSNAINDSNQYDIVIRSSNNENQYNAILPIDNEKPSWIQELKGGVWLNKFYQFFSTKNLQDAEIKLSFSTLFDNFLQEMKNEEGILQSNISFLIKEIEALVEKTLKVDEQLRDNTLEKKSYLAIIAEKSSRFFPFLNLSSEAQSILEVIEKYNRNSKAETRSFYKELKRLLPKKQAQETETPIDHKSLLKKLRQELIPYSPLSTQDHWLNKSLILIAADIDETPLALQQILLLTYDLIIAYGATTEISNSKEKMKQFSEEFNSMLRERILGRNEDLHSKEKYFLQLRDFIQEKFNFDWSPLHKKLCEKSLNILNKQLIENQINTLSQNTEQLISTFNSQKDQLTTTFDQSLETLLSSISIHENKTYILNELYKEIEESTFEDNTYQIRSLIIIEAHIHAVSLSATSLIEIYDLINQYTNQPEHQNNDFLASLDILLQKITTSEKSNDAKYEQLNELKSYIKTYKKQLNSSKAAYVLFKNKINDTLNELKNKSSVHINSHEIAPSIEVARPKETSEASYFQPPEEDTNYPDGDAYSDIDDNEEIFPVDSDDFPQEVTPSIQPTPVYNENDIIFSRINLLLEQYSIQGITSELDNELHTILTTIQETPEKKSISDSLWNKIDELFKNQINPHWERVLIFRSAYTLSVPFLIQAAISIYDLINIDSKELSSKHSINHNQEKKPATLWSKMFSHSIEFNKILHSTLHEIEEISDITLKKNSWDALMQYLLHIKKYFRLNDYKYKIIESYIQEKLSGNQTKESKMASDSHSTSEKKTKKSLSLLNIAPSLYKILLIIFKDGNDASKLETILPLIESHHNQEGFFKRLADFIANQKRELLKFFTDQKRDYSTENNFNALFEQAIKQKLISYQKELLAASFQKESHAFIHVIYAQLLFNVINKIKPETLEITLDSISKELFSNEHNDIDAEKTIELLYPIQENESADNTNNNPDTASSIPQTPLKSQSPTFFSKLDTAKNVVTPKKDEPPKNSSPSRNLISSIRVEENKSSHTTLEGSTLNILHDSVAKENCKNALNELKNTSTIQAKINGEISITTENNSAFITVTQKNNDPDTQDSKPTIDIDIIKLHNNRISATENWATGFHLEETEKSAKISQEQAKCIAMAHAMLTTFMQSISNIEKSIKTKDPTTKKVIDNRVKIRLSGRNLQLQEALQKLLKEPPYSEYIRDANPPKERPLTCSPTSVTATVDQINPENSSSSRNESPSPIFSSLVNR